MKRFFFIVAAMLGCLATVSAVDFQTIQPTEAVMQGYNPQALNAEAPDFQFNGTSSMKVGSYTVPVAALDRDGATLAEYDPSSGVRRIGHRPDDSDPTVNPTDPDPAPDMPVGNTPWLLMALMALGYIATRIYRTRNSGAQE